LLQNSVTPSATIFIYSTLQSLSDVSHTPRPYVAARIAFLEGMISNWATHKLGKFVPQRV
jgi:hypothetical protein